MDYCKRSYCFNKGEEIFDERFGTKWRITGMGNVISYIRSLSNVDRFLVFDCGDRILIDQYEAKAVIPEAAIRSADKVIRTSRVLW